MEEATGTRPQTITWYQSCKTWMARYRWSSRFPQDLCHGMGSGRAPTKNGQLLGPRTHKTHSCTVLRRKMLPGYQYILIWAIQRCWAALLVEAPQSVSHKCSGQRVPPLLQSVFSSVDGYLVPAVSHRTFFGTFRSHITAQTSRAPQVPRGTVSACLVTTITTVHVLIEMR